MGLFSEPPNPAATEPVAQSERERNMLLTCNLQNTNIFFGVFDNDALIFDAQITTYREKSADEYAVLIHDICAMNGLPLADVDGAIIASVVRPLSSVLGQAIEKLTHRKPLLIGPGTKTGLSIKTDIPSQVGADIVANAVAAAALFPSPLVILDFSTATTLAGLNEAGELCGVLIHPGVRSSLDALSAQAADLPSVALDNPRHLLGKNTIDSMVGGVIYGNAAMIDGLLDRIAQEWQTDAITAVATGDYAQPVIAHCRSRFPIHYVANLALLGLRRIYGLNAKSKAT
jgi:type III pantothenate kinase